MSDPSSKLTFLSVPVRARILFDISRPKSLSHKEHFYVAVTSCNSIRNVYIRVLKNSSLEIPGNPIFFLLDNAPGSLPGRAQSRDKKGSVVEIECKFREGLGKADGRTDTRVRVYIETHKRANF